MYNATMRHIRATIVALEKQLSVTYSERLFVALVIQCASRMHLVIVSHVASLTPPH
jgi:transcriptional regulatory protein LevR